MTSRLILGNQALADGTASPRTLRSRHDRIYRNVYVEKGGEVDARSRAVAAYLWSDRHSTVGGVSAAALHGAKWIDPRLPAELFRRNGKPVDGIVIHRDELRDDERQVIDGVSVTTAARTAYDLARRSGRTLAVVRVDALAQATGVSAAAVATVAARHPGTRGIRQLREVIALMDDGAESPQETRTRLALIDAGLPRPTTQIPVGNWRVDMGYDDVRVGIEYDGVQHWTDPRQHRGDIDRLAGLLALEWRIVRVSADLLRDRRDVIVRRTCAALREAGAEWPVIARILG